MLRTCNSLNESKKIDKKHFYVDKFLFLYINIYLRNFKLFKNKINIIYGFFFSYQFKKIFNFSFTILSDDEY